MTRFRPRLRQRPQRATPLPLRRSLLVSSLLAALPGLAGAACNVSGTATRSVEHCDTDYVQYYAGSGSVVLEVDGAQLNSGGVELAPSRPDLETDTTGGPYDQTVHLIGGTTITYPAYSGVIMQSYKAGRKATVTADASVHITSGGGFGGIWVRNDTSGDVSITSAATVRSSNGDGDGITGVTNDGNVAVSNSGRVISDLARGLYADGGHDNLETDPVLVSILNDTGGWVTADLAGARSINYQGMSQIENRALVESSTRQGLVAWSNNGPAKIINSGTASSGDDHGIQVATEKGNATVINSGSVTANDNPAITVARSGYAAIYAEVDLDTSVNGTPGAHGDIDLTNTATGNVQAPADYALYMATPEGNITLLNQGTAHGLHGAWVNAVNGTVDLSNSGTLSGTDPAGIGLRVLAANAGTVVNSGALSGTTTSIKTDAAATLSSLRNLAGGSLDGHLQLAGAGAVYNAGVLTLPASGNSTVAGSYTQSDNGSAGRLRLVVTGPNGYGKLSVGGAVSLPDQSSIEVLTRDGAGCAAIPAGTTLASVVSSGTSLSLGNVAVSDDCDHMNFRAVRNGLAVNLVSELPVQAACGDAVNHATAFAPTQNLCLRGTAGAVGSGSPWSWTCQGTPGGSDAVCTVPNASTSGGSPLDGLGRADLSSPPGNTNAWVVDPSSKGFISTTDPAAPARLPVGVNFPFGLFDVKLVTGDPGSQAQLRITYPNPLPAGSAWWKYGKTQGNPSPHWYVYSGAVLSGNTVTLTLQDGGAGDDDLRINSEIVDPGGVGIADPAAMLTNVPTLSEWGLALLAALMAGLGLAGGRGRRPRA